MWYNRGKQGGDEMEQLSIFSSAKREGKLSALGDNLEKLNEMVN